MIINTLNLGQWVIWYVQFQPNIIPFIASCKESFIQCRQVIHCVCAYYQWQQYPLPKYADTAKRTLKWLNYRIRPPTETYYLQKIIHHAHTLEEIHPCTKSYPCNWGNYTEENHCPCMCVYVCVFWKSAWLSIVDPIAYTQYGMLNLSVYVIMPRGVAAREIR